MPFDFDNPKNRRNTDSLKWDVGENELPLWVADMDFETAPAVKAELLKVADRGIFGYANLPDEYFESVADFFERRFGYRPDPSHMVYSNGIVAAISSMVRKLTTPGENVLIQAPVYNIFYNSILNNGRNVISNDLVYKNGGYEIDFSDLEEKLKDPQTTLMILCNPHNPVGKIWSREELAQIGELCKKHSVTVISDEIHCAFTVPGKKYVPFASVSDTCAEISAICVSNSKSFNLAGLQSAAVIVKNPTLRHKVWRGINTDEVGEPNVFAVRANIAAYTKGDEWLDAVVKYIFDNKRFACEYIKENIPSLSATCSEATYLLWIDISKCDKDSRDFARELREKTGLYISNGAAYGSGGEKFIRINLATSRDILTRALTMLRDYVKEI